MEFLGARIKLNPRPAQRKDIELEVAMLGHCPGRIRFERLLALSETMQEIRELGFGARLDQRIEEQAHLYHLPLPLHSYAEFEDIFPDAAQEKTRYKSRLAGEQAWLPQAVEDFFSNGGEKLWVVQVPEEAHVNGFLPHFDTPLYDVDNLLGIASVLVLNRVGVIAMPDLERIQIAAQLEDIPRLRLLNPQPEFSPCSTVYDDGHRERRHSHEIPLNVEPMNCIELLKKILAFTHKHRPDIQCLFTLPLAWSETLGSPAVDPLAITELEQARKQNGAHLLRQVQILFPYLRNERLALYSPVGLVSGLLANSARSRGIWRSIAHQPFVTDGQPYPELSQVERITLRESPGMGVLTRKNAVVFLDDERIAVPAIFKNDYSPGEYGKKLNGLRSGEVVRFIGFLIRQLRELGEKLIFDTDYRDPRPRLLLEKFFNALYEQGALRGRVAQEAYRLHQSFPAEGVIAVDIEIAPAYPIDRIELTLVNRDGNWYSEANNV